MSIRTAAGYQGAFGREPSWDQAPPRFQPLHLLAEDIRQIAVYESRRQLVAGHLAAPDHLVRSHVEGGLSALAERHSLMHLLPLVTGGDWQQQQGVSTLTVTGSATPPSIGFVRRLGPRDDWRHFSGLRLTRLRLTPSSEGAVIMQASLIGARQTRLARPLLARPLLARPLLARSIPAEQAAVPIVAPPPSGLSLVRVGAGQATSSAVLAGGFEIQLMRRDMAPHFALGADTPQMITTGQLAIRTDLRLLANDHARALAHEGTLMALDLRLTVPGQAAASVHLEIPRLRVTSAAELADVGGGPVILRLTAVAEPHLIRQQHLIRVTLGSPPSRGQS